MKTPRRQFLKQTALGVGGIFLGSQLGAAEAAAPASIASARKFDPFATVPLGRSKLKVSRFCLGTGMKGGMRQSNHTRMGREKLERLIHGAYDRGARMFDLADLYGTHPYIISALHDIPRDQFTIVSKIWFRPGGIPETERPDPDVVVERFLKELKTDYIDLVLLHCVVSPKWPQELARQMEIMARLKEKGVIRAHGVSCHSLVALEAAATEPWVDSVHTRINPYGMSMDGPPEKVVPVLQKLHAAGKGVVGMKIIGEGRLRNDPEKRSASVAFTLGLGCVDVLNVGCESTDEIDDLAMRVREVPALT
jgi:aryl-alcohol dehydrogenase-like predicted oxidoreductase